MTESISVPTIGIGSGSHTTGQVQVLHDLLNLSLKPPPFARQKMTVDDLRSSLTPEDRARFRDEILSARNEGLFTPPALRGTIEMPGNNGGANWSGAAL